MNGKIICVWGSPGSGKTTLSLALAARFMQDKKTTIIVNNSKILPSLKVLAPTSNVTAQHSIGALLMSNRLDDATIASRFVFHPESENIAFIGRAPGDSYITYSTFKTENIIRLLNRLVYIADFIIVDADTVLPEDEIAQVAMELADYRVCCITPDNRGIIYFNANISVFQEDKYHIDKMIRVLGNIKDISPVPETMQIMGKFDYMLPYSYEVESKYIGGELIQGMSRSDGLDYEEEVTRLAEGFLNGDIHKQD